MQGFQASRAVNIFSGTVTVSSGKDFTATVNTTRLLWTYYRRRMLKGEDGEGSFVQWPSDQIKKEGKDHSQVETFACYIFIVQRGFVLCLTVASCGTKSRYKAAVSRNKMWICISYRMNIMASTYELRNKVVALSTKPSTVNGYRHISHKCEKQLQEVWQPWQL